MGGRPDKFQIHIRRTQSRQPQSAASHLQLSCRCPEMHDRVSLCAVLSTVMRAPSVVGKKKNKNTPHLESYEVANVSCANPSDVALLALPSWFEVYPESTSQYVRKPLGTVRRICSVDLCLFPLRKGKDKCQVEKEKACAASDGTCKFEGVACLTHEDVKGIFVCNTEGTFGHQIVGCLSE